MLLDLGRGYVLINPLQVENIIVEMHLMHLTHGTSQLSLAHLKRAQNMTSAHGWAVILSFISRVLAFLYF